MNEYKQLVYSTEFIAYDEDGNKIKNFVLDDGAWAAITEAIREWEDDHNTQPCPKCGDGLMQDSSHPYCEREGCYDGVAEARLKKESKKRILIRKKKKTKEELLREEEENMKTIPWVRRNAWLLDFSKTQEEWEAEEEPIESDSEEDE